MVYFKKAGWSQSLSSQKRVKEPPTQSVETIGAISIEVWKCSYFRSMLAVKETIIQNYATNISLQNTQQATAARNQTQALWKLRCLRRDNF